MNYETEIHDWLLGNRQLIQYQLKDSIELRNSVLKSESLEYHDEVEEQFAELARLKIAVEISYCLTIPVSDVIIEIEELLNLHNLKRYLDL